MTNEVKSAATKAGLPWRSLWAANNALNVAAVRVKTGDRCYYEWRLYQDDFFGDDERKMLLTPTKGMWRGL